MGNEKVNALVLAAGQGKRMGGDIPKQYLPLCGKPIMVYALEVFQKSPVNEIVLVVAPGEVDYCRKEIIEKYHITKAVTVVEGGEERYDSVYAGLQASSCDYVLIHDGARAFLTVELVERCLEEVRHHSACVVGVPSKDTVKLVTEEGVVESTPDRKRVWNVQTPQCFSYPLIKEAYAAMLEAGAEGMTDDAMVVEAMTDVPVAMIPGSYDNIKVTTPEDLILGEKILKNRARF